jgi:hypothetical protein
MALFRKTGKLLKNSAINHDLSMSVFQATRSMSSANLFVGGILVIYHVHISNSKWNVAIIFQVSIKMQVFHIILMKPVSENILLAMGKFLMVIYFLHF